MLHFFSAIRLLHDHLTLASIETLNHPTLVPTIGLWRRYQNLVSYIYKGSTHVNVLHDFVIKVNYHIKYFFSNGMHIYSILFFGFYLFCYQHFVDLFPIIITQRHCIKCLKQSNTWCKVEFNQSMVVVILTAFNHFNVVQYFSFVCLTGKYLKRIPVYWCHFIHCWRILS